MAKKKNKEKSNLDWVLGDLEKAFPWSVFKWEKVIETCKIQYMHTGSHVLDMAMWWWLVRGKMITIYWMEWHLKTTTTVLMIVEAIKRWEKVVFIDVENSANIPHRENLWLDILWGNFIYIRATTCEECFDKIEQLAETWEVDLIVIDSVAALPTHEEVAWDNDMKQMASLAKVLGKWLRKCNAIISKKKTALVMINQIRHKLWWYWNPETLPWWHAPNFWAYHKIRMGSPELIEVDDTVIWATSSYKIKKTKTNSLIRSGKYTIYRDSWIDKILDTLNAAVMLWVIKKAWSWFSYWDIKVQGLDWLKALDVDSLQDIEDDVIKNIELLRDGHDFERVDWVFNPKIDNESKDK